MQHTPRPQPHLEQGRLVIPRRDLWMLWGGIVAIILLALATLFWLVEPAPPRTLVISAGAQDSSFFLPAAQAYKEILARNGITLKILPSDGSLQNLRRLLDPSQHVDIALVQGGVAQGLDTSRLMSLGSMFYAPVIVLYRGEGVSRLSQFAGKRIAIGQVGSGTRVLALDLLKANGITPGGPTTLLPMDGEDAARQLVDGTVDAVILNGDSTARNTMVRLFKTPGIAMLDFSQAAAYTRRFRYLNEIDLPLACWIWARTFRPIRCIWSARWWN